MKKFDVYVSMRARIALRKAGLIPIYDKKDGEALEASLIDSEINAVKSGSPGYPVTVNDIINAFIRGDEVELFTSDY